MSQAWSVYILASDARAVLYTGIALDVDKRLAAHNAGKGAKYTLAHRPWRVVYVEPDHSHSTALKRERAIKKLSRRAKLLLCDQRRSPPGGRRKSPPPRKPRARNAAL